MRNRELNILYFDRNDYLENHPIKTGSTSYASKKGCEAVDSCYEVLYEVLNMSEAYYTDIDTLSYNYLAYQQKLIDYLADYMAAWQMIEEGIKE